MGGTMILILLILGLSLPVSAQMQELIGTLTVDGMMNAEAIKGYNTANIQVKKNNLMQELQMKSIEIQTLMMMNPQNVSRETFSIVGYSASAQKEKGGIFSITIKGVEKTLCQSIENQFAGSKKRTINQNNTCSDKNNIKFYY